MLRVDEALRPELRGSGLLRRAGIIRRAAGRAAAPDQAALAAAAIVRGDRDLLCNERGRAASRRARQANDARSTRMIPLRDDNPSELRPLLTVSLIVIATAVFFWQLSLGPRGGAAAVYSLGLIPSVLFGIERLPPELTVVPPAATVLTSMFLHGGWLHLISNMLYLWIFGDNVESAMGHVRFLLFYVLCGVAAALAQALPDPHSSLPMIGASGAISGVLGAYLLLYPHAHVLVAVPIGFFLHTMRLPAGVVLLLWFGLQFLSNLLAQQPGGGVAFRAHIGGFVAGMVLVGLFKRPGFRLANPLRR